MGSQKGNNLYIITTCYLNESNESNVSKK